MTPSNKDRPMWLSENVNRLVQVHADDDPSKLAIKLSHLSAEERNMIVDQVRGRQKARQKFPFLLNYPGIVYAKGISIEQASSEETALFKSNLFSGKHAIDLTAGFGIDAIFMARHFSNMTLIEADKNLHDIDKHNFSELGLHQVILRHEKAESFLEKLNEEVDLIYIDPSRRIGGRKIFRIEDCEPDLLKLLPILVKKSRNVLVKLSPMADIQDILNKVTELSSLHVVGLNGECKEILLTIKRGVAFDGRIRCVELGKKPFDFSFDLSREKELSIGTSSMKRYVYIPDVVLTKAGAFKSPTLSFGVEKISANTHLYTSESMMASFPGKILECSAVLAYNRNKLKELSEDKGFQLIKRNFPDDISGIAKKLKIGLSGKRYLLAYRNGQDKPELAICQAPEPS